MVFGRNPEETLESFKEAVAKRVYEGTPERNLCSKFMGGIPEDSSSILQD